MEIEITQGLRQNTQCLRNFACLSEKTRNVCKIKYCVDNKNFFIENEENNGCNYKFPYGYTFMCRCPVRKDIYLRYKI